MFEIQYEGFMDGSANHAEASAKGCIEVRPTLKSNNRSTKLFSEIIGIIYDFKNRKLIY